MKKKMPILAILIPILSISQPYNGTIFIESKILTAQDSSVFKSLSYEGQGQNQVFDRRSNSWININAFLFNIQSHDNWIAKAVINPEFASIDSAKSQAAKYAFLIGQLPNCLRTDIDEIWIHKGTQLFGGGNRSILIHTGQTSIYEKDGILEETLIHEACHTSLDSRHATNANWIRAQQNDDAFISTYAKQNPSREDIAESFLLWLAVRHRKNKISTENFETITETIPNRLKYFDSIDCNLAPFFINETPPSILNNGRLIERKLDSEFPNYKINGQVLDDFRGQ